MLKTLHFTNAVINKINGSANKNKLLKIFNNLVYSVDSITFFAICACFLDYDNSLNRDTGEEFLLKFKSFKNNYDKMGELFNNIVFNEIVNINTADSKYSIGDTEELAEIIKKYLNYNSEFKDDPEVAIPIVDFTKNNDDVLTVKTKNNDHTYYPEYIPANAISNPDIYSVFAANNTYNKTDLKRIISLNRYIKANKNK